jgi:hypothetical protein
VLIGAGGKRFAEAHVRETARLINALPLGRGDYVYFSPLDVEPCGRYAIKAVADAVETLSDVEMRVQEQSIRAALRFDPQRGRPYVARYELQTFVY